MTQQPIVIIGAGVIGVMSAQALAALGHRVIVLDREPGPAQLCSRANAGIIAVGDAQSWAAPEAILTLMRAMAGREPGVRVTRLGDPALWRWGLAFLRNCTRARHDANTDRLARLSAFSRETLRAVAQDLGLEDLLRHDGGLYLYSDAEDLARAAGAHGANSAQPMDALDRAALFDREGALALAQDRFAGALFSKRDSVGDCHVFTKGAAQDLATRGSVTFRYDSEVSGFDTVDGHIRGVRLGDEVITAQHVLLATGVETPDLTRPLGFAPLIYPVKGYSGTWALRDPARLPALPYIDEAAHLAVAVYGGQLRVTAFAEFAGRDRSLPSHRIAVLKDYVTRNFGLAVDLDRVTFWTGLRPTTPAGPPYLGRVRRYDNLWINAGHGTLGWTTSAGCGALIAQAMTGDTPELRNVSARARWLDPI
ncbi:FAD-dependent oxidoreductase [uncultured Thioclava sp.]|uniref:FAD-dependent oxidoreductase n=1 Tax=uncultured Thioclava sp. TaxID=473858 RepID=UPI0025D23DF5|nr:FAD-dependent oxidoreductase [uncultured Thioclava sp.]